MPIFCSMYFVRNVFPKFRNNAFSFRKKVLGSSHFSQSENKAQIDLEPPASLSSEKPSVNNWEVVSSPVKYVIYFDNDKRVVTGDLSYNPLTLTNGNLTETTTPFTSYLHTCNLSSLIIHCMPCTVIS